MEKARYILNDAKDTLPLTEHTTYLQIVKRRLEMLRTGLIFSRRQVVGRCRPNKSTLSGTSFVEETVPEPTTEQLRAVFLRAAVPMIGFGFMDQTVMLQAGHMIDCTIGVTLGLSTLTAAAFGQVCSDAAGVLCGGTVESLAHAAGLPPNTLTVAQRQLQHVKRVKFTGNLAGVLLGCCLGLLNLLFIDTERSTTLKLQELTSEHEFSFTIEASNAVREDITALTVRGPNVDGVLASMTTALASRGCSLVELHAKSVSENEIEDVFYVVNRETGQQYEDDDLNELARSVMDSTRKPMSVLLVHNRLREMEDINASLKERVQTLESVMIDQQITVIPRG